MGSQQPQESTTIAVETLISEDASYGLAESGSVDAGAPRQLDLPRAALIAGAGCRTELFSEVLPGERYVQHPYNRCYVVTSSWPNNVQKVSSGYALNPTRILTSDMHVNASSVRVIRAFKTDPNGGTTFEQANANRIQTWSQDLRNNNIGLRYCILALNSAVTIQGIEGDHTYGTLTGIQVSFNSNSLPLTLLTHGPVGELVEGTETEEPQRITTGSVAEFYVTHVGGFNPQVNGNTTTDFLLGSPIFVSTEGGPVNSPPVSTDVVLVGLVTGGIAPTVPCSVNVGMFVDDGAIDRLLNDLGPS